jgi:ADP-ribose pyrophosphatase
MRTTIPPGARLIPKNAKKVFTGKIYDVYQWEQELYDGSTDTFEMLTRPDTIQVIGIQDGKLVILKEQQPGSGPAFYGLPGGRHDVEAETELDAAKREMLEETGLSFSNWKLIEVTQPHTKIEWFVYLFVADNVSGKTNQHLDPGEKIEITPMTLEEVRKLSGDPAVRNLPRELFKRIASIDELVRLPEYQVAS